MKGSSVYRGFTVQFDIVVSHLRESSRMELKNKPPRPLTFDQQQRDGGRRL